MHPRADALLKRTRGELEKERITALQEVVDGKAVELLQLSVVNSELHRHEELLAELVDFREVQVRRAAAHREDMNERISETF